MDTGCNGYWRFHRRTLLQGAAAGAGAWLTPVAEALTRAAEKSNAPQRPKSVIVLWLQGAPSQLDTFDPQPKARGAAGVPAIETSAPNILLAEGCVRLAEVMNDVALVRSVVSKEGDHERATYNTKTGFRPDPTLVHPSIGAVMCHQLSDDVEIPRHVSILPGQWPARGGYLGDRFDAFQINDPAQPIPDVRKRVDEDRFERRVKGLFDVVEEEFARGRMRKLDESKTLHATSIRSALRMMNSEELAAFDVSKEAASVQREYGNTPFGRGCLAAVRLIQAGVRCVEVTLDGWDSHANNEQLQRGRVDILDPAFAALVKDLKRRELWEQTVVLCGGEFGRTPRLNQLEGRDHWPHGFSMALAGGAVRGGTVVGATSTEVKDDQADKWKHIENPRPVEDVHATIYQALGIEFQKELMTPVGRPMAICKGQPILELLHDS